jgi:hypothetical protein
MKLDLNRLTTLAERATPGPWTNPESVPKAIVSVPVPYENLLGLDSEGYAIVSNDRDLAFMTACSPDVVLALVARIRRLEAALERIKVRTAGLKFHDGEYQIAREALEDNHD